MTMLALCAGWRALRPQAWVCLLMGWGGSLLWVAWMARGLMFFQ